MSSLERYDRQLRIEGWEQDLLYSTTAFIAGAGAIGCEVAKNLAMMGIGRLILVDYDYVELSNLSRQLLFRDADIGRGKAEVAAERLREINPQVKVDHHNSDIRDLEEDIYRDVDIVLSCLDNWASRRWLNSVAVSLNKPLIDGGINGFYGNVQVVIPKRTACLECQSMQLIPREEKLAECTLKRRRPEDLVNDLREQGIDLSVELAEELFRLNIKTVYDLKYARLDLVLSHKEGEIFRAIEELRSKLMPKIPAIQSVASVVAGIITTHAIQLIHKDRLGKSPTGLIVYDALNSRLTRVKISRDPACIVCSENEAAPINFPFDLRQTVLRLKEAVASVFGFPDPEILHADRRLNDDDVLYDAGVRENDILYVSTKRLYEPVAIRIVT
ncbi:MAG: ThiF family adenylyltransferase [Nitrososphaerota archaeon]